MVKSSLFLLLLLFLSAAWSEAQGPVTAEDYFNRGLARQRNHDLDGAIADYTQAIALNPKLARAYNNRGVARRDKGEFDSAIADHSEAIVLNPNNANAYYNR